MSAEISLAVETEYDLQTDRYVRRLVARIPGVVSTHVPWLPSDDPLEEARLLISAMRELADVLSKTPGLVAPQTVGITNDPLEQPPEGA